MVFYAKNSTPKHLMCWWDWKIKGKVYSEEFMNYKDKIFMYEYGL